MWRQITHYKEEDKTREITDESMIRMMAQVMFLKQAGEDITLGIGCTNENYEVTTYVVTRKNGGKVVVNEFVHEK